MNRRTFLKNMAAICAAPAIARVASLMQVAPLVLVPPMSMAGFYLSQEGFYIMDHGGDKIMTWDGSGLRLTGVNPRLAE